MTKYQFGAFLLIVAGVQLVLAVKIASLSKRKSSEQSTQIQVEIDRLDTLSKRISVVSRVAVLVFLCVGYFSESPMCLVGPESTVGLALQRKFKSSSDQKRELPEN